MAEHFPNAQRAIFLIFFSTGLMTLTSKDHR